MQIPDFASYGVSPVTGFLPEELPLERLPLAWEPWEAIAEKLPNLIETAHVRSVVDALPRLEAGKLAGVREQRRAYSILGFIAHAYIWSPPKACDHLPRQIADPLLSLGNTLGLPPLATYAGLCLWNFRKNEGDSWDLSNLRMLESFTGSKDEAWFYMISVALEKQGGPCLDNGVGALRACMVGDEAQVAQRLRKLATDIEGLTQIMMRLSENLDPMFFYNKLRPYLAGSKGMAQAGLPQGVFYGAEDEPRQYSGGSNGQSSLIQALDILLNVEHFALGHRTPPAPVSRKVSDSDTEFALSKTKEHANPFLMEMRQYMPREHRDFLAALEKCAIIRPFVMARREFHPELAEAYDDCLQTLRTFRSKHIQVVMRYVSLPSRSQGTRGVGLSSSSGGGGEKGTGGTELMPFLKQTRDETSDAAAGDWNRNIVSSVNKLSNY